MKFSVLLSVYKNDNVDFFKESLVSVTKEQTLRPNQVVVVKDGPVDERIDSIIESIKTECTDIEFTIVSKSNNSGLAAALNTGIECCKYDWIARMDSDDVSHPDRFKRQVDFLKSNPSVHVLGSFIMDFENSPGDKSLIRKVGINHKDITKMAKKRSPMNHPSVFYYKKDIINAGGYNLNVGKLEDYRLWIDLLLAGVVFANLNCILLYMRTGNGLLKRRSDKKEIKDWNALQKYMHSHHFISFFRMLINRFSFRLFTICPIFIKKIAYKIALRS